MNRKTPLQKNNRKPAATPSARLAQWKKALQPIEVELSAGTMLVRPVKLESLVIAGQIPLTLAKALAEVKTSITSPDDVDEETLAVMTEAFNAVTIAAAIDPPVTRDGDENSLAVDDIPLADRMQIFSVLSKAAGASAYAEFPEGQEGS